MGEDLSNKVIMALAIIAIIMSLSGTFMFYSKMKGEKITAAATTTQALARLNITSRASINFTISRIDWGSGYVNDTALYCQLNSEGLNNPANCTNFTTVSEGFRLENDGNRNVELNLSSNNTAAQFIGGTNPIYQWKFLNNESDSCGSHGIGSSCVINSSALTPQVYTTVSTAPILACPCFRASDTSDLLNVELQIRVPSDSYTGLRETVITAVGTAI
jgi:type II secretory pathway pseudopilin PulG